MKKTSSILRLALPCLFAVAVLAGGTGSWVPQPLACRELTAQAFAGQIGWLVAVTLRDNSAPSGLFRAVDVLVTGAMLAGGSEGIHRMANGFISFMDNLSTRADQGKPPAPAPVA